MKIVNIGFIGHNLNLLSGSGKPAFQLIKNLNHKKHKTFILSDMLEEDLDHIQTFLIKKNAMEDININRVEKNLLFSLIKKDFDTISNIDNILKKSDLVICSDFIFP